MSSLGDGCGGHRWLFRTRQVTGMEHARRGT
jgi:hypothetical protein